MVNTGKKMSKPKISQDEEMETRVILLESLIQTKNKEIDSCQKRVVDYNRLQDEFMNSQHKLIGLQTEFDKISAENEKLRKQLKSLKISVKSSGESYCKTKHARLITKSSQTSGDDFQAASQKWYQENTGYSTSTINKYEETSAYRRTEPNVEKDFAAELVKDVTEAASEMVREQYLASMVYEETSGLYYDYKTGYYFDAERSLFYDGNR